MSHTKIITKGDESVTLSHVALTKLSEYSHVLVLSSVTTEPFIRVFFPFCSARIWRPWVETPGNNKQYSRFQVG